MQYRKFGSTDLQPSVIGLGAAPLGSRTSPKESIEVLNEAFDLGITFYDTAPSYGQGESEKIIGKVFEKKRDKVIITTKVGRYPTYALQMAAKFKPLARKVLQKLSGNGIRQPVQSSVQTFIRSQTKSNFQPSTLSQSVEASLRRLRCDYIDLLLLHDIPQSTETDKVFELLQSLKQQGKVRYYGVSASSLEETLMWLEHPEWEVSALQLPVNLLRLNIIDQCLPIAQHRGIAVIGREPLAGGKLIPSTVNDANRLTYLGANQSDSRFAFLRENNIRTMAQAGLQFVYQTEGVSVVLTGMSKVAHVRENVAALKLPELTPQEMEMIRSMSICVA